MEQLASVFPNCRPNTYLACPPVLIGPHRRTPGGRAITRQQELQLGADHGHTYLLARRVFPPWARQEILLFNLLCAWDSLSVDSVWCEALADACTTGEEKEALAAIFIRLAFSDALAPEMLLEDSDENSLPPSSTRRAKNWPESASLGLGCAHVKHRRRKEAYRTFGATLPGPVCFQWLPVPSNTGRLIPYSICRSKSPPGETVSAAGQYPSTRTGAALPHTL